MKQLYIALLLLLGCQLAVANENLFAVSATITGPSAVCQNSTGQIITFTGSGGTAPYTFTYTIGGNPQTVAISSGNTATVTIPTGTPGPITYALVSVHDAASPTVEVLSPGSVTVNVNPSPTVNFTFTNDNTCSGTVLQFSPTVTGIGPYTYLWDFGDSSTSTQQSPTHSFISLGCGTANFIVTLTVTGGGCTVIQTRTVQVMQKPDIDFRDANTTPSNQFNNCQNAAVNPVYTITVNNNSISNCISSFSINWGDGNTQNNATFPISHTYNLVGAYNMVITANGNNGCLNSKTYIIKNVSNPLGGLNSPGSTQNLCAPTGNLQFSISNWGANSLDTTYSVNYGDNTPILVLTQTQLNNSSYYVATNPASSLNYPVPHIYTVSNCPQGSYLIKLDVTNACGTTPFTLGNITVITKPIANFTCPPKACITTNVLFTNTSIPGYDGGCDTSTRYIWNFGDPSGTNNIIDTGFVTSNPNSNHTFSNFGTYTVTLSAQNSCGTTNYTQTICIEPPLVPQFTLNNTSGCVPLAVTATNTTSLTNQCSAPTYLWQVTYTAANCGSGVTIPNQITSNASYNFTEPGTYNIKLTTTNSCGSVTSATQIVTVKKPPTITSINGISATYCGTATINPTATVSPCSPSGMLNYAWSFPGGNPSTSTSAAPGPISYTTAGPHTVSLVVSNECGNSNTQTATFNVNTAPVVTNTPLSQSICSGTATALVNLTANPSGATFTWTANATLGITGFTSSGTNTIPVQTITTTNSSAGTVTYIITPSFNGCIGTPVNYVITINPSPNVTFSPSPQTICSGDTSAAVTLNSVAGATLNWTTIQPAGISGVTVTSGTTTIPAQTLINSTNAPITITYNATAVTSGGSTCAGANYPYTIIVKPAPLVSQNYTATVCSGTAFSVIPVNTLPNVIPTGTTYSWALPTVTGSMTGGNTGSSQTSITGTLNNPTDTVQTAVYTVTPTTNGCIGASFTVTVTVNPKPSIANVTPPSICSGSSFTVTPASGGVNLVPSGTTYTWTVSSNINITGQSASNAGGVTSISQTLVNTTNTNQVVTYTVTPTSGTCPGNTFTITVTVNPKPTVANTTSTICSGNSFSVTPINGSSNIIPAGTTYTWGIPVSNPSGAITGGSDQIVGQNTISQTLNNITNNQATLTYTVTPVSGSCTGNTFTIIVTVDPIPGPLSLTNQLYCNGAATSVIPFNNAVVGTTYSWTNSNPAIGLAASGTVNIPFFTPINTTNNAIMATISVIATANGCSRAAETFTITVNPAPTVIFSPATQTICSGDTSAAVTLSSTISGATFSWTVVPPSGISGINPTSGSNTIPNQTLTNTTNAPIVITYDANATTASGSTCPGASYQYRITVNPIPSVTESFAPSVCSNELFTVSPDATLNAIPAGTIYSWTTPTVTGGMTGGTSGTNQNSITGTLNNPTNINQTAIYTVTPSANGCPGSSFTFTVIVNPKPIIANVISPDICSDATFTITPGNAGDSIPAGTTYTWTVAPNTNVTGQSDSAIIGVTSISQTLTNSSNVNQTLIYTVQPVSGNCSGSPFTITVTVKPKPVIANVTPAAICSGNSFSVIPFNGSGNIVPAGTTYTWTAPISNPPSAITGGTSESTGQSSISQTLTNSTNDIATLTYTVTPTSGSCVGTTFTVTVTLSPLPVVSPQTATICSNNAFTVAPSSSGNIIPLGTTYTWSAPSISPTGSINGASSEASPQINISQNLINTTTNPATVTYTVTPTSGTCVGNTFTVTITVNPSINPNVIVTNNACFGVDIASISTNITGGIPPYTISWSGPNSYTSASANINTLEPGNYNLIINDMGNCPFTGSYTITEPTDIVITTDSENDISCYAANDGSINITVSGGTGNYTYTWTKGTTPYAVTEDVVNLSPDTYTVSVTDANSCGPKTATFIITEPPLLVVSLVSQTNVLCYGASTGAITVNVIGGTPASGYVFAWTGPGGFISNSQNLSSISAGVYNLVVTDANGCFKNLSVNITQSTEILIAYTTTPITCYGANNASLSVTLSGGNAPYTFTWNNLSTSLSQTNLSAGNYIITVTDNVGCIKTETIVIPEAPVFTVNPIVTNVSCFGANNGSINLNLTGGITPVALTWSDGSTAGLIRNNLPPGTYSATISDGTPCYIVRTFTIVQPQPLVLSANITNAFNCTNASSGAIDLVVAGGTMPYAYSWSNGAVVEDLTGLTSGNYLINVTDANGCTKSTQYSIVRPDPISITISTQTTFDCAAHTVNQNFVAQASGGIPPYQYNWSSGTITGVNNEIMHSGVNGTVLLTVTDSNSCTATQSVTVDTPILGYPSFDTTSFGFVTYGIYTIGDPIQFNSTITGDYESVSWDFGDGTFSTDLNPIHTYLIPKDYIVKQTVTYPFGCVYVQTITLIIEKGYVLVVPTAFTPNSDTLNDTYRPVTKGLKNVILDIYDTWGSLIYSETGDVLVGWDGKIKGFNAENGNYYSKVKAETFYGTVVNSNQTFVLIK